MKSRTQSTVSASEALYVAPGQLLDLRPDVAQEVVPVAPLVELGLRVEELHVAVERELHVHVEHDAAREQEREVGDAPAALDRDLLPVLDALDETRQREDVLGHALAPLAPGPAARQGFA